jgi:hypothetical protein
VHLIDWLTTYSIVGRDTIRQVEDAITPVSKVELFETGLVYHNGYVNNTKTGRKLGVSYNKERESISVKVCPNKFILGNNVEEASIRDVNFMFNDLSNLFSYDFGTAMVKRLDVTHTAQTEYTPLAYYPYMCYQDKFDRHQRDTSLYYQKQGITKLFYDKVNEVSSRKTWGGRQRIPSELADKNLFRFEVRLNSTKQINKAIAMPVGQQATLIDIMQDSSIEQLQKLWINEYNNIPKMTEIPFDFTNKQGAREFKEEIIQVALANYGRKNIEELYKYAIDCGTLKTRKQIYDAKKILDVFDTRAQKCYIIQELDEKIKACEPKLM